MPARPLRRSASCLYGKTHRIGEVHEGTATMDWMEQEQSAASRLRPRRRLAPARHSHQHYRYARHVDFTRGGALAARARRRGCGVDAVHGCSRSRKKSGARPTSTACRAFALLIRSTDGCGFRACYRYHPQAADAKPVAIQIPIGQEDKFKGVIDSDQHEGDRVARRHHGRRVCDRRNSRRAEEESRSIPRPAVESIAENDDEILHKFLEGEEINADALRASLRKSTIALKVFPVWWGRHSRIRCAAAAGCGG